MAITATLVYAGHNRLRYLVSSSAGGESLSIEGDGGPTPDLLTDSIAGPIKQIMLVKGQGYGIIPSTGLTTQAQARALLMSDNATTLVGTTPPTAICSIDQITGAPQSWVIEAVRGPSDQTTPGVTLTNVSAGGASCYFTLEVQGVIGG